MEAPKAVQHKLETPSLSHALLSDWQFVYEPAEDTFLLLDALEKDMDFIASKKPKICLEVGCGSGVIITALSQVLRSSAYCLAIDINKYACKLTQKTSIQNNAFIDILEADLTFCFRKFFIDLIIFNPPYVVTPSDEIRSKDCLTRSWAGGVNGREVIDRFLNVLHEVLDSCGFGYILLLRENNPREVIDILLEKNFAANVVKCRKIRSEELYVIKFQRNA